MVAGVPGQGGAAWAVLSWVLGLRALGHDIVLVDETPTPIDDAMRATLAAVVERFDLGGNVALIGPGGESAGAAFADVVAWAEGADLLVNLGGTLRDPEVRDRPSRRLYVDLDPGFTQVWAASGIDMGIDAHSHHATVGLEVGRAGWALPDLGVEWIRTPPVVDVAAWAGAGSGPPTRAWTTVGHWRGYGSAAWEGATLGQRAHSWRRVMPLPGMTDAVLEPALAIHPDEEKDIAALDEHGWRLHDPAAVAADTDAYRRFVGGSRGELGVAKAGYVDAATGWFSDRSACYLAAGRPVVAQETGWSSVLPSGEGLLAYTTAEEAAAAIAEVEADYARHAEAARAVAREHLAADRLLPRLLEAVA